LGTRETDEIYPHGLRERGQNEPEFHYSSLPLRVPSEVEGQLLPYVATSEIFQIEDGALASFGGELLVLAPPEDPNDVPLDIRKSNAYVYDRRPFGGDLTRPEKKRDR